MDSIADLVDPTRFHQPDELSVIKAFIKDTYASDCQLTANEHQIAITVPGAALAGTLRFDLPQLKETLQTNKKLIIRIGH